MTNITNYLFLSCLIPEEREKKIKDLSKRNMQDAANELQWKIYNGLCENLGQGIHIVNKLPVGSFPQYYKKAFVETEYFSTKHNAVNVNVGFCNIKFLRNFFVVKPIYREILKWCKHNKDEKIIFMYTLSLPFIKVIEKIKKKYSNVSICAIVADLPNMSCLSKKRNKIQDIFIKTSSKKVYKKIQCVDYFVLLSKHMAEYMKVNKPYCIMEGISTENTIETVNNTKKKIIVYSGTLHEKFGVLNLVQAFQQIKNSNYELIICGIGDSQAKIEAATKIDDRIKFMGQLSHDEVIELQRHATVLVNPRQNIEEFTKYSFPSKNLEYLSSGVPLIAYKLDGIPDEYDDYIIYPKSNSVEDLAKCIEKICNLNEEERRQIGTKAKKFVSENKNYIVQTKKIIDLIENK